MDLYSIIIIFRDSLYRTKTVTGTLRRKRDGSYLVAPCVPSSVSMSYGVLYSLAPALCPGSLVPTSRS